MQIPEAGHCLTLFGPVSGFEPLNRVWFSFTIVSVKQGIHKLSFLKGVSFWTGSLSKELMRLFAMISVLCAPNQFYSINNVIMNFGKYFYSVCKKENELGS